MRAEKLILNNFRNFGNLELTFEPGLTIITGENGAGKTNILEALYMCSIGRSPRTRQDTLLIKKGKNACNVHLEYLRADSTRSVGVNINTTKGKSVVIDGEPTVKVSNIVGNFSCVYFSPDEIEIVRGGPQFRRRFMDIINCQISPHYMASLKSFQNALKQRNALLKTLKVTGYYDKSLVPWDTQIITYSLKIMLRRQNFLKVLQKSVNTIMRILTDNTETLRITYKTFCDRIDQVNLNDIEKIYQDKVRQNYAKDILTHTSSIGPHLDDFEIKLGYIRRVPKEQSKKAGCDVCDYVEEFDYINLRNEGSLGQQRTATLALKIAEIFLYHKYFGEKPMLLLDDVLSELDYNRRKKLMDYCRHFDTVVTCTEWDNEAEPDTILKIQNGEVVTIYKNDAPKEQKLSGLEQEFNAPFKNDDEN